jgi:predicted nucleic acid-binding protein
LQTDFANQAQAWRQADLLDWGEAEALALTRQLTADWFITDDTSARVLAASLGIEVYGSLGIVLWAAATRHLNRADAESALDRLSASTLWLSSRVLKEAKDALDRIFTPAAP